MRAEQIVAKWSSNIAFHSTCLSDILGGGGLGGGVNKMCHTLEGGGGRMIDSHRHKSLSIIRQYIVYREEHSIHLLVEGYV